MENIEVEEVEIVESVEARCEGYDKQGERRSSVLLCKNAEFPHTREESGAVHSQACGSTIGTTHASFTCSQGAYDLVALLSFIFISDARFLTC